MVLVRKRERGAIDVMLGHRSWGHGSQDKEKEGNGEDDRSGSLMSAGRVALLASGEHTVASRGFKSVFVPGSRKQSPRA
jgi:hypothetical protein